jgi:hypothetical protein
MEGGVTGREGPQRGLMRAASPVELVAQSPVMIVRHGNEPSTPALSFFLRADRAAWPSRRASRRNASRRAAWLLQRGADAHSISSAHLATKVNSSEAYESYKPRSFAREDSREDAFAIVPSRSLSLRALLISRSIYCRMSLPRVGTRPRQ